MGDCHNLDNNYTEGKQAYTVSYDSSWSYCSQHDAEHKIENVVTVPSFLNF